MKYKTFLTLAFVFSSMSFASEPLQQKFLELEPLLQPSIEIYPNLQLALKNAQTYQIQILFTQIDRNAQNIPSLTTYQFNLNEDKYFYPASTVKLPMSLLALEWVNEHRNKGITSDTTMLTDAKQSWQVEQHIDETSQNGKPSIAHYIKKILLVSDNDGSNRLYELMGQDYINSKLKEKGLTNSVINHRLSVPVTDEQNPTVNPIRFIDNHNKLIYKLEERTASREYINESMPSIGKAYYADGVLINKPMDFTKKNRFSLVDLDGVTKRFIFPSLYTQEQRFHISDNDRDLMLRYMSLVPPYSDYPKYDVNKYPYNYSKFFMYAGKAQKIPSNILIFNKTGSAYGHALDTAYIVDLDNKVEFFLTAIIYTNENEVLNDDTYQVNEIAKPFMNELGNLLYQHELKREKRHQPNLVEFEKYRMKH